jgi:hypothetical protein
MNLYDFQPWHLRGICSFFTASANHYVATFDETTVLKFPVVPREERMKYQGSYVWTDVSYDLLMADGQQLIVLSEISESLVD